MIELLVPKHHALVVLLLETHCHDAEKLVLPVFALAGATRSRKHGIATFVLEKLSWSLSGQSSNESDIEWLRVDVCGFKIIKVYKPSPLQMTPRQFQCSPILVSMLVTSTANTRIRAALIPMKMEAA